ncbi:hypothetical protein TrCOL_g13739 [Triparma columacea]|uniref:Prenyltransferase alpha-alpha toroid domain-containing protein n=1 Tax=Triparma columacea TaxID=722753 RepID=A0A9W7GEJ7_9STRA|nr:hypothetical protein TrCOL_g13739 [Triparma columacea]
MTDTEEKQSYSQKLHWQYLHYSLSGLPGAYSGLDTNRLTLVHFLVHSLSITSDVRLFAPQSSEVRSRLISWILNLLVTSGTGPTATAGFTGGTSIGNPFTPFTPTSSSSSSPPPPRVETTHHIAMTYCALLTLLSLSYDITTLPCHAIMNGVKSLQNLSPGPLQGSFKSHGEGSESDMRFNYCAVTIERVLWKCLNPTLPYDGKDCTYIDKKTLLEYCKGCKTYDGGIGLVPGLESHGGSYFTCLATLSTLDMIGEVFESEECLDRLERWGVRRQIGGMQGRTGKAEDTCYSYWVGGGIRILGTYRGGDDADKCELPEPGKVVEFIMKCQHPRFGGFGKNVGAPPDIMHTFYSLCYLSMSGVEGDKMGEVDVVLGCDGKVGEWVRRDGVGYGVCIEEHEKRMKGEGD